jgi:biotin operon repressor
MDKSMEKSPGERQEGYFIQYVRSRIARNKNFMVAITGPTGSGKTFAGIGWAIALNPDWRPRTGCVFSVKEFLLRVQNPDTKSGDVILFDEAGVGMNSRTWFSVQNRVMNYLMQTFRHRNLIIIFTSPDLSFMDSASRKMLHCHAETMRMNIEKKTNTLKPLFIQVNQRTGDMYFKYLRIVIPGAGIMPLKSVTIRRAPSDIIEEYEEMKREFTDSLNAGLLAQIEELDERERGPILSDRQQQLIELIKEGVTRDQICYKMDISRANIGSIIKGLRAKGVNVKSVKLGVEVQKYEILTDSNRLGDVLARAPLKQFGDTRKVPVVVKEEGIIPVDDDKDEAISL